MGFFQELKENLSQAVNELLPDENVLNSKENGDQVELLDEALASVELQNKVGDFEPKTTEDISESGKTETDDIAAELTQEFRELMQEAEKEVTSDFITETYTVSPEEEPVHAYEESAKAEEPKEEEPVFSLEDAFGSSFSQEDMSVAEEVTAASDMSALEESVFGSAITPFGENAFGMDATEEGVSLDSIKPFGENAFGVEEAQEAESLEDIKPFGENAFGYEAEESTEDTDATEVTSFEADAFGLDISEESSVEETAEEAAVEETFDMGFSFTEETTETVEEAQSEEFTDFAGVYEESAMGVAEQTEENTSLWGERTMEAGRAMAVEETAIITGGMKISGDVTSEGSMDVIGNIEGNIDILGKLNVTGTVNGNSKASEIYADGARITGEVHSEGSVKIGQSSVVIGNIYATSAVIAGAVKGDIDVQGPVILDSSAIVMGNIKSKAVQINNGAVIEGMCSQCYADVSPTNFFNDLKK